MRKNLAFSIKHRSLQHWNTPKSLLFTNLNNKVVSNTCRIKGARRCRCCNNVDHNNGNNNNGNNNNDNDKTCADYGVLECSFNTTSGCHITTIDTSFCCDINYMDISGCSNRDKVCALGGTVEKLCNKDVSGCSSRPEPSNDRCWRDAKALYNRFADPMAADGTPPTTPITIGYWGACPELVGCAKGDASGGDASGIVGEFRDIDLTYDVVILSFLELCDKDDGVASCSEPSAPNMTNFMYLNLSHAPEKTKNIREEIINRQKNPNKFVLASIGGARGTASGSAWDPDKLFDSWCKVAESYKLDGIDIDMENIAFNITLWKQFLKKISDGGWIISCAPQLVTTTIGIIDSVHANDGSRGCGWLWCLNPPGIINQNSSTEYNWMIGPDMWDDVDIISLQIYQNNVVASDTANNLTNIIYSWLVSLHTTCIGDCSFGAPWNTYPNTCSDWGGKRDSLDTYLDPSKSTMSTCANGNWQIFPKNIQRKFFIGFVGRDGRASEDPHYRWLFKTDGKNADTPFRKYPNSWGAVKDISKFFRGIMVWSIDQYSLETGITMTKFLKEIIQDGWHTS